MTVGADAGPRRQLRFALSMNGGVSLAVWIGGTVCEIDCLRRGDGFWGELLEACGYESRALVDVMTGASAGGLNAVLYAQSIRAGVAYDAEILQLWEDTAGIEDLIKPARSAADKDPRAVLRGVYFREKLLERVEAFERIAVDASTRCHPDDTRALAIFASATLATANTVHYRDAPGAPVEEARSDAYFHVARRGPASRGLDGFADPSWPGILPNTEALASIGRATCSLPVLFEPVRFDRTSMASRLIGAFTADRDSADIVDGGVVDNVPIARAIRAIASSPANTLTRRVLLYLHPDPSHRSDRVDEPATAIAVGRSLFGKRSESLREDIDLLRAHNASVTRRDALAHDLLSSFIRTRTIRDRDLDVQASLGNACLMRAAIDPATELPWHAPTVARLAPLLDGSRSIGHAELERTIEGSDAADSLVALRARRIVGYLLRLVREVERTQAEADGTSDVSAVSAVKERLYEILLLADLLHAYQLARFLGHGPSQDSLDPGVAAVRRLRASRLELASIRSPATLAEVSDSTWRSLAAWDLPSPMQTGENPAATVALADLLMVEMRAVLDELSRRRGSAGDTGADTAQVETTASVALDGLQAHELTLDDLDRLLLPLALEPVASDQAIAFVRVAGNVESPASLAFDARSGGDVGGRITGVQLRHLGAFFQRSWRRNDWWWGRLDSVPALLDAVLDPKAIAELRRSGAQRPDTPLGVLVVAAGDNDNALRHQLLCHRQAQLIAARLGSTTPPADTTPPSAMLAAVTATPEFGAWAGENRSLQHLLGTASLTSTALRAVVTAWKVLTADKTRRVHALLAFLRPVLLGIVGLVLAGRRAVPTMTLTLCLLAASRFDSPGGRTATFTVGLVLALLTALIVERRVRPTHEDGRQWAGSAMWLYGLTLLFAAVGSAACIHHDWVREQTFLWFAIPPVVAMTCALLLFFWMSHLGRAVMVTVSGLLYGLWSLNATRTRGSGVLDWYPLRSLWVCWLAVIILTTSLLGRLPDRWLRPRRTV